LKEFRKDTIIAKKKEDIVSELPTLKHAYKVLYDYASRAFLFGKFNPEKLLQSDDSEAIRICASYTEFVARKYVLTLILREVQHIDLHSLQVLLLLAEKHPGPDIVIEYTSENKKFKPEHHKLILIALERRKEAKLLDLLQLGRDHLDYLIRTNVTDDFTLTSDYYLSWDGNLRSIIELKFRVSVGQSVKGVGFINNALSNIESTITQHVSNLSGLEKNLLAIIVANIEAIEAGLICDIAISINPLETQPSVVKALVILKEKHAFITNHIGFVSISNDTILQAIVEAPGLKALIAMSEKKLKEYYSRVLKDVSGTPFILNATRQAFRLCAKTSDVNGLIWLKNHLASQIKDSQDQSIYIDAISSALELNPSFLNSDKHGFLEWSIQLAYSAGDWARVVSLIEMASTTNSFSSIAYACALQEVGRHAECLSIVEKIRNTSVQDSEEWKAATLIKILVVGCKGDETSARSLLDELTSDASKQGSPFLGYAYRFYEIVSPIDESLLNLQRSIDWFKTKSMHESMAYSQLSAAMLKARTGELKEASELIEQAANVLYGKVYDHHILLNNTCAIEILKDVPNYDHCIDELNQALRFARDDFSELTIIVNLCISYIGKQSISEAVTCADKCMKILQQHDFADTNVYWPACFNCLVAYTKAGLIDKADEARSFPQNNANSSKEKMYWDFRYSLVDSCPKEYEFLASREFHPIYLSHWLIDLEGLIHLKVKGI